MENEQRKSVCDIFKPSKEEREILQQSPEGAEARCPGAHLGVSALGSRCSQLVLCYSYAQQPCDMALGESERALPAECLPVQVWSA